MSQDVVYRFLARLPWLLLLLLLLLLLPFTPLSRDSAATQRSLFVCELEVVSAGATITALHRGMQLWGLRSTERDRVYVVTP